MSYGSGNDYRFLLLGKTGSGKSTTGNSILGAKVFSVGNAFGSVTDTCELRRRNHLGKNMEIMDSPGLFDTRRTHEEISIDIVRSVAGMHPGPHAMLYVIPVGRYTKEEYDVYKRLKALFDEHLTRYLIVLFTGGDRLNPGQTIDSLLKSNNIPEELTKVMGECGHRYVLFNNLASDTTPYVRQLLQMVDAMNRNNRGQPYSCPKYELVGQGLEAEVQRRLAEVEKRDLERTKYVKQLQQQTDAAKRAAEQERINFERREQERKEQMKREQERREREMREIQQKKQEAERQRDEERKARERMEEERKAQIKAQQGVVIKTSGNITVTKSTSWSVAIAVSDKYAVVTTPGEEIQSNQIGGGSVKSKMSSNNGRVAIESKSKTIVIRTSTSGMIVEVLGRNGISLSGTIGGGYSDSGMLVMSQGSDLNIVVSAEILSVK